MILVSNKGRWPILTSSKRLTSTGFPWTTALLFFTMSVPVIFGIHMAALLLNLFRKLWIPFQYISVRMFLSLSNSPFYSRLVDVDVFSSESDPAPHQKAGKSDGPLRVLRCLGVVKNWRLPENSPFNGKVIINHKILGFLLSIHLCNRGTWLPSDLKPIKGTFLEHMETMGAEASPCFLQPGRRESEVCWWEKNMSLRKAVPLTLEIIPEVEHRGWRRPHYRAVCSRDWVLGW
jgi:hypothetical protein